MADAGGNIILKLMTDMAEVKSSLKTLIETSEALQGAFGVFADSFAEFVDLAQARHDNHEERLRKLEGR